MSIPSAVSAAPQPSNIALHDSERTRCEVWTRVMGYHRPVSEFNPGKQSEHAQRQHFVEHPVHVETPPEVAR